MPAYAHTFLPISAQADVGDIASAWVGDALSDPSEIPLRHDPLTSQEDSFGLYNVGAGETVQIRELVRRIVSASGRDLSIEHDLGQPTIPTTICLDCAKANKAFGWAPGVPLEEGISRTIAWWRKNIGAVSGIDTTTSD